MISKQNHKKQKTRSGQTKARSPKAYGLDVWWQILKRIYHALGNDQIGLLSAGIAFYMMISFIPLFIATLSIYGLVGDPQTLAKQLLQIDLALPGAARDFFHSQLNELYSSSESALGISAILSIFVSLYSASKAAKSLIIAVNRVYDEEETRSFITLRAYSLIFTIGGIFLMLLSIGAIVILPTILSILPQSPFFAKLADTSKWGLLIIAFMTALAVLDRYGPDRSPAKWRWVSWGAILSALLWLLASFGFQYYVTNFASYNKVYGSLAGVIVLMLWFYLMSYIILLGAEFNAEVEHQTKIDSTTGSPEPMGERGAVKADTSP